MTDPTLPAPVTRVLLCAAPTLSREGVRAVVRSCTGLTVAREAADGAEAAELARSLRPDLLIVEEALPELDGVALAGGLGGVAAPAVLLLAPGGDERVVEGLRAGVRGLLHRDCDPAELRRAIEAVTGGRWFLSPQVTGAVARWVCGQSPAGQPPAGQSLVTARRPLATMLTQREREVLALLSDGLSNEEIGARLFVSRPTVKYHVSHLLRKLDVRDRLQAAVLAHQCGITEHPAGRGTTAASTAATPPRR